MARLTWLPDVLRAAGLDVHEMAGWETRGSTRITPKAVVCHHTASPRAASDARVDVLLRDGRPDLKGPLSQLGLRRDGSFVVVAAGRANHNGFGTFGNDSIGIEAYNDGRGEPWPMVQVDAYHRGAAALLTHLGLPVERCMGHKETDPRRKIDPTLDMDNFRRAVAAHMEDDDMALTPEDRKALVDDIAEAVAVKLTGFPAMGGDTRWIDGRLDLLYDRLQARIHTAQSGLAKAIRERVPKS